MPKRSLLGSRTQRCLLSLGLLVVAAPGCDDDDFGLGRDAAAGNAGRDGGLAGTGGRDGGLGGSGGGDAGMTALTPGQAAGVVLEANAGEIQAGGLALSHASSSAARGYAMKMVDEHSMAQQRLLTLLTSLGIPAQDSALKQQLEAEAQAAVGQLSTLSGAAFDTAYLQSQVMMHMRVLTLLDQHLLPAVAANVQLRTELTATRAAVAMHLAQAQALLGGNPDGGADAGGTGGAGGAGGGAGGSGGSPDAGADGPA